MFDNSLPPWWLIATVVFFDSVFLVTCFTFEKSKNHHGELKQTSLLFKLFFNDSLSNFIFTKNKLGEKNEFRTYKKQKC